MDNEGLRFEQSVCNTSTQLKERLRELCLDCACVFSSDAWSKGRVALVSCRVSSSRRWCVRELSFRSLSHLSQNFTFKRAVPLTHITPRSVLFPSKMKSEESENFCSAHSSTQQHHQQPHQCPLCPKSFSSARWSSLTYMRILISHWMEQLNFMNSLHN